MKILLFLITRSLFFVTPPFLYPTGIYLNGDPDIIVISDSNQRKQEYRVPKDKIGVQLKIRLSDNSFANVYINRDDKNFYQVMNPPINEFTEEKLNLIPLNDFRLVVIMHKYLQAVFPSAYNWSIDKTIDIINILDKTIQRRMKSPSSQKFSKKELREIKKTIEEIKEKGFFDKLKTTSSISSRMTFTQVENSDTDLD